MKRMVSAVLAGLAALGLASCAPLADTCEDERQEGLAVPALF